MDLEKIKEQYPEWQSPTHPNVHDMKGMQFGHLTVLYRYYQNKEGHKAQ